MEEIVSDDSATDMTQGSETELEDYDIEFEETDILNQRKSKRISDEDMSSSESRYFTKLGLPPPVTHSDEDDAGIDGDDDDARRCRRRSQSQHRNQEDYSETQQDNSDLLCVNCEDCTIL